MDEADDLAKLSAEVDQLFARPSRTDESLTLLGRFRAALNAGSIRVAENIDDQWQVNAWVKRGIVLHAQLGVLVDSSPFGDRINFDLDTLPLKRFQSSDRVRVPPGGSLIRDGVYIGVGSVCMPPSIINMGAWIGCDASIDSHVTIGNCTQIGNGVRVGSGTQIGGVIEPFEALPTIVSDHAVVGGNCGLYDGVFIGEGAVIGAGTVLTGMSRVYDFRSKRMFKAGVTQPLIIPPLSIVVPGSRPLFKGAAEASGLSIHVAVIIGQRDQTGIDQTLLDELMS